jgi:hypothetical protein
MMTASVTAHTETKSNRESPSKQDLAITICIYVGTDQALLPVPKESQHQ